MSEHKEMMAQSKRLVNLNQFEVLLGIVIAVITIANAVGSWYVMPYRVGEAEKTIVAVKAEVTTLKTIGQIDRELLIRIDERLRQVQRALRIPEDERDFPPNPK